MCQFWLPQNPTVKMLSFFCLLSIYTLRCTPMGTMDCDVSVGDRIASKWQPKSHEVQMRITLSFTFLFILFSTYQRTSQPSHHFTPPKRHVTYLAVKIVIRVAPKLLKIAEKLHSSEYSSEFNIKYLCITWWKIDILLKMVSKIVFQLK